MRRPFGVLQHPDEGFRYRVGEYCASMSPRCERRRVVVFGGGGGGMTRRVKDAFGFTRVRGSGQQE